MTITEKNVQKNLLLLLSAALKEKNKLPARLDLSLWPAICTELQNQTVFPLISNLIPLLPLSDTEIESLIQSSLINFNRFFSLLSEQDQLIQLLSDNNVSFVILKGVAAAIYYPIPEYRQMGDIDLLVAPEDFDRSFFLLKQHGYTTAQSLSQIKRHAEFRSQNGLEIELHHHFSSGNSGRHGKELDRLLFEGFTNIEERFLYNYRIPILPPTENGLVLLSHINQHLSSGLGLRQIIDWMLFVQSYLDDETWYDSFQAATKSIGLETLAVTTTFLCKKYLGLNTAITWCDHADPQLARELLEYLFTKGNFGHKADREKRRTVSAMHRLHNPFTLFSYLNYCGKRHWSAVEDYQFLNYFAWVYQICHLVKNAASRKAGLRTLSGEYSQSRREYLLLKRLEVTRF